MLRKVCKCLAVLFLLITPILICQNAYGKIIKADDAIVVEDYTWASSSVGNQGILKDITLKNKSLQAFENIHIEIELYSRNRVPLGSVKGTIKDVLLPGQTKTFERIKLGLMHTNMQSSIARVIKADLVETGTPILPKNLISVKNWKWLGDQFGTEGILKEITLENRSNNHYKDIKVRINSLTAGDQGYSTSIIIHDVLPAQSTSTYTNVNAGFRHPDSTSTHIYVSDAKEVSSKEFRYIIKKEQKEGKYKTAKKIQISVEDNPNKRLSLAERYRKKVEETKIAYQDTDKPTTGDDQSRLDTEAELFDKETILREKTSDKILPRELENVGYVSDDEVALPEHDIQVRNFRLGSGIPGSQGIIRELTLRNRSGIAYSQINLEAQFLSSTGVLLASNDFTLLDVLPPHSTKTYKNVKLGVIVVLPNERNMKIIVRDAKSNIQ